MANNEQTDKAVKDIAATYRDPEAAKFAINDFRDWQSANDPQTVTLSPEDWDVVRAALGYMVDNTSPVGEVHMQTGRIYHSVRNQTIKGGLLAE